MGVKRQGFEVGLSLTKCENAGEFHHAFGYEASWLWNVDFHASTSGSHEVTSAEQSIDKAPLYCSNADIFKGIPFAKKVPQPCTCRMKNCPLKLGIFIFRMTMYNSFFFFENKWTCKMFCVLFTLWSFSG